MLPRGRRIVCMIQDRFHWLDPYHKDHAQHLITAGQDLDDQEISGACVWGVSHVSHLSGMWKSSTVEKLTELLTKFTITTVVLQLLVYPNIRIDTIDGKVKIQSETTTTTFISALYNMDSNVVPAWIISGMSALMLQLMLEWEIGPFGRVTACLGLPVVY